MKFPDVISELEHPRNNWEARVAFLTLGCFLTVHGGTSSESKGEVQAYFVAPHPDRAFSLQIHKEIMRIIGDEGCVELESLCPGILHDIHVSGGIEPVTRPFPVSMAVLTFDMKLKLTTAKIGALIPVLGSVH